MYILRFAHVSLCLKLKFLWSENLFWQENGDARGASFDTPGQFQWRYSSLLSTKVLNNPLVANCTEKLLILMLISPKNFIKSKKKGIKKWF